MIAILGAGISGMSLAHFLKDKNDIKIFEKDEKPGGLIKCKNVNGNLFHMCGGHVFNSKRQDVLDWFWTQFSCDEEFTKTERNSVVFIDEQNSAKRLDIPYPIENHMFLFDEATQKSFINDLTSIIKNENVNPDNFEEFLKYKFGNTLYKLYFGPYNKKVWRRDLSKIPLSWLEGKLPMPTITDIIYNNFNHVKEKSFVHSSFWYEKKNGSQYIVDQLAKGLNIQCNTNIKKIIYENGKWLINGEIFEKVIFCGNIMDLPSMIIGVNLNQYKEKINCLEYHGTTSAFCEIDANPYSWIYLPSQNHESHRIICTGNFSKNNNNKQMPSNRITATIEFTDYITKESIIDNLTRIPLHPKYLDHKYNKFTYPIQDKNTREMIHHLKSYLSKFGFYMTGRFADWEYYNMDAAFGASLDLAKSF